MSKLKPCPFCGGAASRDSKTYGNGSAYAWIFCLKCGCATPKIPISLDYSAKGKADELWNRRAEDAQTAMEMPKSCFYCPFREKVNVNPNDYVCMAMNREVEETFALILGRRHKDCPLVEVPDHGDLIDRDAAPQLVAVLYTDVTGTAVNPTYKIDLSSLPVVIPADKEGV